MAFFSTTALGPGSPAFRGRAAELARLARLCREEVTRYGVIYGGRQNGKSSLLFQLPGAVEQTARLCRIDFQQIQGAPPERVFALLAEQIDTVVPLGGDTSTITSAPRLKARLNEALARSEVGRLVLMLDELGALPPASREALGNALRSFFHDRLVSPPLQKLLVIFSGGVELYSMVVSEVSSLHNVCEEIYLPDLPEVEAVTLIADGLQAAGVDAALSGELGRAVYAQVSGHPYLTQRMGELLVGYHLASATLRPTDVARVAEEIIADAPPLLRRIRDDLRQHQLEDAARRLLRDRPGFSRLDDELVRLELIGLAKRDGAHWVPRNPLLATVFREQLGLPPEAPAPPHLSADNKPSPTGRRYSFPIWAIPSLLALLVIVLVFVAWRSISGVVTTLNTTPTAGSSAIQPAQTTLIAGNPTPAPAPNSSPTEASTDALTTTPTPEPIPLPTRAPKLVKVPAGAFLMGSANGDPVADSDEKPQHTLELPDFWIGETEVTNAQFRPFVEGDGYTNRAYWTEAGWAWRNENNITQPNYWNDPAWNSNNHPVVGVSWFEAVAYVRWLSVRTGLEFRLPTEAEWEKAARGPEGRIWPWGGIWESGRANTQEANNGTTTAVGQYLTGASPYGALDMTGNVWEWCATAWRKDYPYQVEDEWADAYLERDAFRVIRGGAWNGDQRFTRGAHRDGDGATGRHDTLGLRVASDAPLPSSEQ